MHSIKQLIIINLYSLNLSRFFLFLLLRSYKSDYTKCACPICLFVFFCKNKQKLFFRNKIVDFSHRTNFIAKMVVLFDWDCKPGGLLLTRRSGTLWRAGGSLVQLSFHCLCSASSAQNENLSVGRRHFLFAYTLLFMPRFLYSVL